MWKQSPNSEEAMHRLPVVPPLASLIRCLSRRHEGGCAWPLILSPLSPSPGHSAACSFLPQFLQFLPLPPAAEPHLDFRAERLCPWPCSCRAGIHRAQLVPWGREGAEPGRHVSGAAGNWWSAESMGRLIPVPMEPEKSLPSPRVRGKCAHLTSAKCRDEEIPLHPATMQAPCSKASLLPLEVH